MLLIINRNAIDSDINIIKDKIINLGLEIYENKGFNYHIIGVVGDKNNIDSVEFNKYKAVEKVVLIQEPYMKANRLFHPENTEIKVNDKIIGSKKINIIAGPCSVESEEQVVSIAKSVKKSGASFLRGGAFKPRSSPYSFQGLGIEGLKLLKYAGKLTGLPIVSELTSIKFLDDFVDNVDVIQVGARNMQNFELLKELGKTKTPILLKRGLSSTIEDLLMSAEYILSEGNENVILCERGIRTFEDYTRNTLDLSAIPIIKKLSHLPIIVDPSHGTGLWWLVEPMALAAIAAGADGLMIEVHNNPDEAMSDGGQSMLPEKFQHLMNNLKPISNAVDKEI
ncbi:3-deoxy-7-phosphoheptulonate synthase [Sedimentibacter sp. MB31-C6]|uniref:3-deoxy-7-phosphoheptulonate synthase n=1 Tax=Sedimentibacter sp. MB31-C6 TaxID=3109366 RepID=UPI002DDD6731|nr:3-deoxy-7-phosphoheptulonate synthase [Sedimentibacter sp. MB36-C1]WSI05341.1 3-deoxy-7-phosphoheptulonate synthase [Sedimentibacter sp. MB36-C1]